MQFTLRFMLVFVGLAAVLMGFGWPYINSKLQTVAIHSSEKTIGGRLGWADSAEAYCSSGNPTFIYNETHSEFVPYLNGENLPYLIVVRGGSGEFEIKSSHGLDRENLSTVSRFSIDNLSFRIEHRVHDASEDLTMPPTNVVETLTVNDVDLAFAKGRIVCLDISDGDFELHQHKVARIPADIFRTSQLDDQKRIQRVLAWWRTTNANLEN